MGQNMNISLVFVICLLLREAASCIRRCPARIKSLRKDRWRSWTEWSACSVSCGLGRMGRKRFCASGQNCPSPSELELRQCEMLPCTKSQRHKGDSDRATSEWGPWSPCPTVCGETGYSVRTLICKGKKCQKIDERNPCPPKPCPVDGGWSGWGSWTSCSATCNVGTRYRYRTCTQPEPKHGGKKCEGAKQEATTCFPARKFCQPPVNGGWSRWTAWSACSRSCGPGSQSRSRICSNPAPEFGGTTCNGNDRETQTCQIKSCGPPIHGGWSSWKSWSVCSVRCGSGTRNRVRFCNNPAPANGGRPCVGEQVELKPCLNKCPVDGGWTNWTPMAACKPIIRYLTCTPGRVAVSRKCENPKPAYGGENCKGNSVKVADCWYRKGCDKGLQKPQEFFTQSFSNGSVLVTWKELPYGLRPTNYVFYYSQANSGSSSTYSVVIPPLLGPNPPVKIRQYSKIIDVSRVKGKATAHLEAQRITASENLRSSTASETFTVGTVDGNWSKWNHWTDCDAQCGSGRQRRFRSCNNPPPSTGGRPCRGQNREERSCDSGRFCL